MLKLFMMMWLFYHSAALPLYKPGNILSQNKMLFNSSQSSLSYKQYTIAYSQAFASAPSISYSINNYQTANRFYYQNIQTFISDVQKNSFLINANPIQITSIYKFSICYLAINDAANFVIMDKSYLNPIVYSGHRGSRSVAIREKYNFSSPNIEGKLSVRGFYIQSISQFYVNSEITDIGPRNFTIMISTVSDCSINRLDLSLFFYYPNLTSDDYQIVANSNYCFPDTTSRTIYTIALSTDTSVFYFGISGFGGLTLYSYVDIGWNSNELTNNTLSINININKSSLTYICYTFIQIFSLKQYILPEPIPQPSNGSPPSSTPAEPTQNSINNQNLLIIIVAIVCSLIVLLILIIAVRYYWLSKYYEKETLKLTKKQLSLQSIHELPTLNF